MSPMLTNDYLELAPLSTDMETISEQQFAELTKRADELPDNIRDTLTAEETATSLLNIEQEHSLEREKTRAISKALREVLMGDIAARDLRSRVRKIVLTSPEVADKIVTKLTKEIVTPVYFELQKNRPTPPPQPRTATKLPSEEKENTPHPPTPHRKSPPNLVDLRNTKNDTPPSFKIKKTDGDGSHGPLPS